MEIANVALFNVLSTGPVVDGLLPVNDTLVLSCIAYNIYIWCSADAASILGEHNIHNKSVHLQVLVYQISSH